MVAIGDDRRGDVPFYVAHAREAHGAVLVAACGTGRVLLPVAKAGADADGFDEDPRAVAATHAALAERGLVADVWVATLPALRCRRRYAGLLVPGRALDRLASEAELALALVACRQALAPGAWIVGDIAGPTGPPSSNPSGELRDGASACRWPAAELVDRLRAAGFVTIEIWGDFHELPAGPSSRDTVWRAVVGPCT